MIDEFSPWNRVLSFDEVPILSQSKLMSVAEPSPTVLFGVIAIYRLIRRRRA